MERNLVEAIRQQSDDLRDELKELEKWEEEMTAREKAPKPRAAAVLPNEADLPIRGSVPSIKEALEKKKSQSQKSASTPSQDPVQLAKEKGNEYFRVGKIDDAIHAYSSGIELDPSSPTAYILYGNRAMCYLKEQQWDKAESDASACIQKNRSYAKGYFRRAVARRNLGKLKEARADLESVLALASNDASALAEMETVTKLIQAERAKTTEVAPKKKKIVIEEVEDDEEDTDSKPQISAAAALAAATEEKEREARVQAQLKELDRARAEQAETAKEAALGAEKAREVRRRTNPRVEVVEEEEEEHKGKKSTAGQVAQPAPSPSTSTAVTQDKPARGSEPSKQPPPPAAAGGVDGAVAAAPKPSADEKTTPQSTPSPTAAGSRRSSSPPALRGRPKPTKDSLAAPKSFTAFERVFADVEGDDELRDYYVSLLDPTSLPSLFGSNITPEILVGLLKSVDSLPGDKARQLLKGLSGVNRVEDVALFLSAPEKKLIDTALAKMKAAGGSDKEISAIKRKLRPF